MRIRLHPEARAEFLHSVRFYAKESSRAANRFIDEVEFALDQVSQFPMRFPMYELDTHRIVLKRFPFSIIYQPRTTEVLILAIMHQKRKPGYWETRL